jgi:hypothetical protein
VVLTAEQEREWIAQLEKMGLTEAKSLRDRGEISPAYVFLTSTWIADEEREAKARAEVLQSEQMELTRRSSDAAERQATAAERANTRATIAIWVAAISAASAALSLIISIIAFFEH